MKNIILILVIIILMIFIVINKSPQKNMIRIEGYFYDYIPYNLEYSENFRIKKQGLEIKDLHIDSIQKLKTSRFSLSSSKNSNLILEGDNNIVQIDFKSKHPPIEIRFKSNAKSLASGSTISKKQLLKGGGIIARVNNFDVDFNLKILEFKIRGYRNGLQFESFSNQARLSNHQIELIRSLDKNEVLVFEDIKVKSQRKKVIKLNPFVLYLEM